MPCLLHYRVHFAAPSGGRITVVIALGDCREGWETPEALGRLRLAAFTDASQLVYLRYELLRYPPLVPPPRPLPRTREAPPPVKRRSWVVRLDQADGAAATVLSFLVLSLLGILGFVVLLGTPLLVWMLCFHFLGAYGIFLFDALLLGIGALIYQPSYV